MVLWDNNVELDKNKIITTSIRESDLKFCHQRGLKISRVLKQGIAQLRDNEEGEVDWKFANDRLQKKLEKIADRLMEKLTPEQYNEVFE
jgi:hypothetical protein